MAPPREHGNGKSPLDYRRDPNQTQMHDRKLSFNHQPLEQRSALKSLVVDPMSARCRATTNDRDIVGDGRPGHASTVKQISRSVTMQSSDFDAVASSTAPLTTLGR